MTKRKIPSEIKPICQQAIVNIKEMIESKMGNLDEKMDGFIEQHAKDAESFRNEVARHGNILNGDDRKGGLVASVGRIKEKLGLHGKVGWLIIIVILGLVSNLLITYFNKQ